MPALNSPPIQTPVDVPIGEKFTVSVPWTQWFQNMYSTLAGVLSALTSSVPSPIPVEFTGQQATELQNISEVMNKVLVELKLLNIYLHELPRALNDGDAYTDEDNITLRDELSKEH